MVKRNGSRWRRQLGLALAVTLVAGLAGELSYRVWAFGSPGLSPERLASVRTFGQAGLCQPAATRELHYELRPNLDTLYQLYPFQTSSHGMRDREYALEKPPDTFRIAVIGDSYTMGSGVPIEGVYHSVLEQRLNDRADGTSYECLNFGVAGYPMLQYALVLEQKVLDWDPDLIVIGLISNDVPPPSRQYFEADVYPDSPADPPASYLRLRVLEPLRERLRAQHRRARGRVRSDQTPAQRSAQVLAAAHRPGDPPVPEDDYLRTVFRRIALRSAEAGVPVYCIYLGMGSGSNDQRCTAVLREHAEHFGFGFAEVAPSFRGLDLGKYVIFPFEHHPNAAANAIFAEVLEQALRSGDWLERAK